MDNKDQHKIATTILTQMGGAGRLKAMLGVKCFAYTTDEEGNVYVAFRHMKGSDGINHTRITLMGDDTYTMTFSRIHGMKVTEKAKREMLFFDDLVRAFREETGLELIMPKIHGV